MGMFFGRKRSLTGVMSRRQQTSRAKRRVEETEGDIEALQEEIDDLAMDLESQIAELRADWLEKLSEIEAQAVGLERNDIRLERLELVWVPVSRPI